MIINFRVAQALCVALTFAGAASAQEGGIIVDRDRPDRKPPRTEGRAAPQEKGGVRAPAMQVKPFVLNGVRVEGSSLPPALFDAAITPMRGKTIDGAGVSAVANAAAAVYGRSRVALYAIDAPEQDFADGIVHLHVIEGHITAVNINGQASGDISLVKHYAARMTTESPLSRATMERQLLLISDVPGLKTKVQMAPGAAPGEAALGLQMERQRFEWELGVDNGGSPLLGRTQLQLRLIGNGLLRLGDQTALTVGADSNFDRFLYTALSHRQPIGHSGATLQGSIGHLKTTPPNGVRGKADIAGLVFAYPITRSYQRNLTASLAIDGLNSENAAFGNLIANERTRVARASLAATRSSAWRSSALSGTISVGLDAFGAGASDPSTDIEFRKLNVFASHNRALGKTYVVRLAASAQASGDALPTSERFTLGGTFGRAFGAAELSGDQGFGASAELAWRPRKKGLVSELYGFVDGGQIWTKDRLFSRAVQRDLMSSGVGMRLAVNERVGLDLEAVKALDEPAPGADARDWGLRFGLSSHF